MGGVWRNPRPRQPDTSPCPLTAGEVDARIAEAASAAATRDAIEAYGREVLPQRLGAIGAGPLGGKLTEDELLRRQCLEWAFQTRDFADVPHMQVVAVAREYYDFIRNTDVERRVREYHARCAGEAEQAPS